MRFRRRFWEEWERFWPRFSIVLMRQYIGMADEYKNKVRAEGGRQIEEVSKQTELPTRTPASDTPPEAAFHLITSPLP